MKPKQIGLSLLVGIGALFWAASPAHAADKKPNILVKWGDDIGTALNGSTDRYAMSFEVNDLARIPGRIQSGRGSGLNP